MDAKRIEHVARGLTFAQRKAVCGEFAFATLAEQEEGEAVLYNLGLWKLGHIKRGDSLHTPLGHAVRQWLKDNGYGH